MTAIEKVGNVAIDYQAVLNTLKLNPKDPNVQALILVCQQYELDPVLKHMVLIQGAAYITHKGLWHMAHRSGLLDGEDILETGETDKEWWAKVAVYRKDWQRPITMTGRYPKSATNKQYGPEMAVTRAECLVLRRMFDVAVPVQEEINWPTEVRGGGEVVGNGARVDVQRSAPAALPPANVDPDTGEIMDAEVVTEPKPRPTFAAPRQRPTSAQNTSRINAEFTEADETLIDRTLARDLLKRIGALSGDAVAAFNGGINKAGLVVPTTMKVTKDDYAKFLELLPALDVVAAS